VNYSVPIVGSAKFICANDWYTCVGSTEEIVVMDISNITDPQNYSKISHLNWFYAIDYLAIERKLAAINQYANRDVLFFTDYQRGLFIHNFSKPAENTLVAHYNCGKRIDLVAFNGEFIYVASRAESPFYPAELNILAIINGSVQHLGSYISNSSINDMIIINDFVLLATSTNIEVIDASNPVSPILINKYPLGALNILFDKEKLLLFLCSGMSGLFIIDASDLNNLTLISQVPDLDGFGYYANDVITSNGTAYIADGQTFGGIGVVNVSDPINPSVIGYYPLNALVLSININNELLYVSTDYPQIVIFDITEIADLHKIGEFKSNSRGSDIIQFYGNLLFMAQWLKGLTLIDTSDPHNPTEVISVKDSLNGICVDLSVNGSTIFLADAWDGLEIWELFVTPLKSIWKIAIITVSSLVGLFIITGTLVIIQKRKKVN
jgi:hypothetical protein